jgi:hypothetical protein
MGISKIKKTRRIIKLITALQIRARKGTTSSIVTIWIRGWPPIATVGTDCPVSMMVMEWAVLPKLVAGWELPNPGLLA